MIRAALLINIFILSAASAAALPSYTFTRYLERNGIPTTTVEKIIQDDNGYLWLASWSGLYRFDGMEFVNYRTGPAETRISPAQGRLADIQSDSYGRLWLLTHNNALYRFDPENGETVRPQPPYFRFSDCRALISASSPTTEPSSEANTTETARAVR